MTPEQLRALGREHALFLIAHQLVHRLLEIEPDAVAIDADSGRSGLFTTTEEGAFLATTLRMIDDMMRERLI